MIVNDPAHSVVLYFEMTVLEEAQIDPMSIDTDEDGIYDAWEVRYGLKEDVSDSFVDTDHDTFTNFQEFQNGTDPVRASSHPPYPEGVEREDATARDDKADQYRSITLALLLVGLIVVLVLVILALSRRRVFRNEVDEEKEIESDEVEYRNAIEAKRAERLSSMEGKKA